MAFGLKLSPWLVMLLLVVHEQSMPGRMPFWQGLTSSAFASFCAKIEATYRQKNRQQSNKYGL